MSHEVLAKSSQKEAFLGGSWSPLWRQDRPSWSQDGAKTTNLAPKWSQDGQLEAQDGQLDALWGAILAHLGHLGTNFNENGEKAKNLKKLNVFKGFWVVREV